MATLRYVRELPVSDKVDVLVVGGGMAGTSAAIAAARLGAKTMLIERHATLGGAASTCGLGSFCGETRGQGEVFDDIIDGLARLDAIVPYRPYEEMEARQFDHQILPFVLQELALKAGVILLLHTRFVDLDYIDGAVSHVILAGKSGPEAIRPVMVIDCTGEADVVHSAGLPTFKGRNEDHAQFPMGLMFFMRDVGHARQPILPEGCDWLEQGDLPMISVYEDKTTLPADQTSPSRRVMPKIGIKMKVIGYDSTDTRQLSNAEVFARRRMFSVMHYLQRNGYPTFRFDHVAAQIGIREGRRIQGEYVLTEEDVQTGGKFDDGVALGTFYLDAMDPDTDKKAYIPDKHGRIKFQPPPYHIPFRSLRPRGSQNLLVAGRCLSSDLHANSSARVLTTASMMGQASGIAAAMCADAGISTARLNVGELRAALVHRNAKL